jgi:Integrase core domain
VRDELLGVELFQTLTEAQVMVADWREDYNHNRPHSALGMTAPARFAASWRQNAETAKGIIKGELPEGRRSPHSAPTPAALARIGAKPGPRVDQDGLGVSLRSPYGLPARDAEPPGTTLQPPTDPRLSQQVDR